MMHQGENKAAFDPGNYPALLEFLPGYLHEDFAEEYGSAAKAIAALLADASTDQIREVQQEWHALRQSFAGRGLHELQHAFGAFGTAWQPQSEYELQAIDEILSRAEA